MLRDNRYDAILHMVTAADGAEAFYASLTNEARYESIEEATIKDKRLRDAYMGHSKWCFISNRTLDFNTKINNAKECIHNILGHKSGS
jgi:predicted aminopeptidase